MNNKKQAFRNGCKTAGVALLTACLALLPLGVFAVADAARFQAAAPVQQAYVPIVPSGEDFYLLRTLQSRAKARVRNPSQPDGEEKTNSLNFYLAAKTGPGAMTQSYEAGLYALQLLNSLEESGALPQDWAQTIIWKTQATPDRFFTSVDTLGLVTITYFEETTDPTTFLTVFSMVVDGKTGAVISLFVSDAQKHEEANRTVALEAFVQQTGLSALADWSVPNGTSYEESGLYSARGGALATCADGKYASAYYQPTQPMRFYYSLQLSMLAEEQLTGIAQ